MATDSIDLNALRPRLRHQTVDTVAGQTYNVTFAMSGNPADGEDLGHKTMTVSAGVTSAGLHLRPVTAANTFSNMMYVDKTFSFVGTGSPVDADLHEHNLDGRLGESPAPLSTTW